MSTDTTMDDASIFTDETPEPERTRLIQVWPNTNMFSGWGPRMETSISAMLRNRN